MKTDLIPGTRGGVFDLPKAEWTSRSGRIEIAASVFGKKDHLVCSVCEPSGRHCNAPPLGKADYLLSELFIMHVSHSPKLSKSLQKSLARITLPYYDVSNCPVTEMTLRLLARAKREEGWLPVADAQFDTAEKTVTFSALPIGHFAVVGSVKAETFEISSNGCLYNSRLNHAISVRIPKGGVTQSAACTLRILPVSRSKLQQARTDYPVEMGELAEVSEIFDFETSIVVDNASVQTTQLEQKGNNEGMQNPQNGVSSFMEFKRQATLKLPIPSWFNESVHSVDSLALFYKVAGNDSWNYFMTKLKTQGQALTINTSFLGRFMIALPKEPSRVSRLVATMARVDEYVCTFRGDVSSFVRYDKERKKWDVELTWLRARDGEDRSLDLRMNDYSAKLTADRWAQLIKVQVKPPDEDVPKKRVAWADGTGDKPENEQAAESVDDAWNKMMNPQRRPRKSVQLGTSITKLPCVRDGSVISIAVASDFQAVAAKHDGTLLALYEELPDFAVATTIHCRPSSDVETRVRTFVDNLTLHYSGQLETAPVEPDVIGEIRCVMQNPGNVLQKFVIAVFRLTVAFDELLEYFGLQRPEPLPVQAPSSTPRQSPLPPVVDADETQENRPPAKSKAYEDMMRRIEEVANRNTNSPETPPDKPVVQRTELLRPRLPPVLIQPRPEFCKEPKVLSGRSLQFISRQIDKGLSLGVYLNLKDSVISGIAFDSLSKMNASAADVTYRVLLTWKRTSPSRKLKNNQSGPALVDELVNALEQIGRSDLCEVVKKAFTENTEISANMLNPTVVVT